MFELSDLPKASELSNNALENMELNVGFKSRLPQPTYNPVKGIPQLLKNWPEIEQYLMLGTLYEIGTLEIINPHDKELTEEQEKEIEWIDEDPFIIKPQTQLKGSGRGSKDRPQTPQKKGKETGKQPDLRNKRKINPYLKRRRFK